MPPADSASRAGVTPKASGDRSSRTLAKEYMPDPIHLAIDLNRALRNIRIKAHDALEALTFGSEDSLATIKQYLQNDIEHLKRLWPTGLHSNALGHLYRHVHFAQQNDLHDILRNDLPKIEDKLDKYFYTQTSPQQDESIETLLHPVILKSSYVHFRSGQYRNSVLDAVTALVDLIRQKTKLDKDGANLVEEVFSLDNPYLVFSEIQTESGKNDQKGFIQILKGAYQGIRNPKAHSLNHDLNRDKVVEYLVFASLLARRIEDSTVIQTNG